MYDMIRGIPDGFRATLETMKNFKGESFGRPPLLFTGNGTAFYASLMGSQVLSLLDVPWKAVQSFELASYERIPNTATLVGVSHSGITKNTVDALRIAKKKGAYVIALTHFKDRPISVVADGTMVIGDSPDKSRCHTKTYVDSAAACFSFSLMRAGASSAETKDLATEFHNRLLPKLEDTIRQTERSARKAAEEISDSVKRIFIVGSGPNTVTANEAALKIRESSFLPAVGMALEEVLHGSWMPFDSSTLVIAIVPSGPAVERGKDLVTASRIVGAKTLVVSDSDFDADYLIKVPKTLEYLSPFVSIIPMYFFSYFLSVKLGNNPDYLRYLEPKYWQARSVVFPPGTH
jgi:glutamine---fructose-6-phosphate transaminase (isomerizing)